jgi:pyroglutamyl-peptidase
VTGFEAFAGADENPSARIIGALGSTDWLAAQVLPVSAARLPGRLADLLETYRPDVVLGLGEARGCGVVRVERVAVNVLDSDTPDNDGWLLKGMAVVPDGPAIYRSTAPCDALREAVERSGVACAASDDAGRYICNQMLYLTLHWASGQSHRPRVGFLHVPSLPGQNTAGPTCPTMPLAAQLCALRAAIEALTNGRRG